MVPWPSVVWRAGEGNSCFDCPREFPKSNTKWKVFGGAGTGDGGRGGGGTQAREERIKERTYRIILVKGNVFLHVGLLFG